MTRNLLLPSGFLLFTAGLFETIASRGDKMGEHAVDPRVLTLHLKSGVGQEFSWVI